jgi:soluble lytic murein transglycosylase
MPPRPPLLPLLVLALAQVLAPACVEMLDLAAGAAPLQLWHEARTPAAALAEGRRLFANGEWEAAAEAYRDALGDGGETGRIARFELARVLDKLHRYRDGIEVLAPLLVEPPAELSVRAWFLQALLQADAGNRDAATAAAARYVELGGPAAAYARVERARLLKDDDPEAALGTLAPVVDGGGATLARRQALRLAAQIEESADRPERALARYTALLGLTTWDSDRIAALDGIGRTQAALGNADAAADAYRQLVTQYPATAEAERALDRLAELGRPVDALTAGIVHYRRRNNQRARDLFNAYLQANGAVGPGAATALYYLGALAERRGDTQLALENYDEAYRADPEGALAPEALWARAAVLVEVGQTEAARALYLMLAERFPASQRAAGATFQAGYLAYLAGRPAEARAIWSAAMQAADAQVAARAAFWAGRAAAELGDPVAARLAYTEATRRNPTGYYGLRAAAVLAGEPQAPTLRQGGAFTVPVSDWTQAEAWLSGWAGAEDPAVWQTFTASEDWRAGVELLETGRERTGIDALELALDAAGEQPWLLYRIARAMDTAGQPYLALIAAARLLARAPAGSALQPQAAAIVRLAYPAPWPDLVRTSAAQYGLDPLLVYAMMRQESAFNPLAGSSAGAFGLTQVIPSTAQEIARALGRADFAFADLARPILAIQFGAFYLGGQMRSFADVYQALAAYNAGPGNAARWAAAAPPADVDRFVEAIDYSETSLYLRLVLQNYAWYRYLYGGAARPTLTTAAQ